MQLKLEVGNHLLSESRVTAKRFAEMSSKEQKAYLKKYPKSKHGKGVKKAAPKNLKSKLARIKKKYKAQLDIVTKKLKAAVASKDKAKIETIRKQLAHLMAQHKHNLKQANSGQKVSAIRGKLKSTSSVPVGIPMLFNSRRKGLSTESNSEFSIDFNRTALNVFHDVMSQFGDVVLVGKGMINTNPDNDTNIIGIKVGTRTYYDKAVKHPEIWKKILTKAYTYELGVESSDQARFEDKYVGKMADNAWVVYDAQINLLTIYASKSALSFLAGMDLARSGVR